MESLDTKPRNSKMPPAKGHMQTQQVQNQANPYMINLKNKCNAVSRKDTDIQNPDSTDIASIA